MNHSSNITTMKARWFFLLWVVSGLLLTASRCSSPDTVLSVEGTWQFRKDSLDQGVTQRWFEQELPQTVRLPGSMWDNGKGDEITLKTRWTGDIFDSTFFKDPRFEKYRQPGNIKLPFWLTPDLYYVGPAWYQKKVTIPSSWEGRRVVLFLERAHWETRLWVDGKEAGMQNSLSTPHEYDLTSLLSPGTHVLTIRVDNRIREIHVGVNSHSVSDHTQGNWNGIVGAMELRSGNPVYMDDIQIYPEVSQKRVRVEATVVNTTGEEVEARLLLQASGGAEALARTEVSGKVPAGGRVKWQKEYPMGEHPVLWSEFNPEMYAMEAVLVSPSGQDTRTIDFGMREFSVRDRLFHVNGNPVFLRGTLECNIFPLTGYPPVDTASWGRIYRIIKAHGLNHIRFHSQCPPEAAFVAADRAGVYLQVECGSWANQGAVIGSGLPLDSFIYRETERIIRAYGNHPSFCMMAYGNEPSGRNSNTYLGQYVTHFKKLDPRRLFTAGAGWPQLPVNDYHSFSDTRIQRWGEGTRSILNAREPQTVFDHRATASRWDIPVVSHEIGQWCVFPNFEEMKKYTGVLKPRNFELFREDLADHDMADQARDFLLASGKLQALCYKADIEAQFRSPGLGGFQLLDLHDFPGQGSALVGVLDAFWDEKGYISAEEFRRFCGPTVPLARMEHFVYTRNQEFTADLEVAHFGQSPLTSVIPSWKVRDALGKEVSSGVLPVRNIALGMEQKLGEVRFPLGTLSAPARYTFEVSVAGHVNQWDFWVYPESLPAPDASGVYVCNRLDEQAHEVLRRGGTVLFLSFGQVTRGSEVATGFSTIFWNTAWTNKQPPHTMGIFCNPEHPALADFPTEFHSNWQWWDITAHAQAMLLDHYPSGFRPLVQWIDTWFENRKLGLVVEAQVEDGKLLMCSADISGAGASRPVARQLYHSLLRYAAGPQFRPATKVSWETVTEGFK
jgi:hypothetical protein